MESTVVPLELYYEHRNYAPALLMFWPIALWLSAEGDVAKPGTTSGVLRVSPTIRRLLALALIGGLAVMTWLGADLWGNTAQQALVWALKNPDSPRAQAYAAQIEVSRGQTVAAIARLERALASSPDDLQLSLNLIGAKCRAGSLESIDIERAERGLRNAPNSGRLGYDWFDRALAMAEDGTCPGLTLATLEKMLTTASENRRTEKIAGRRQDRLHLLGRIALRRGDPERALELFDAALDADTRPDPALEQAGLLGTAGYPELAERHLTHFTSEWQPPSGPGLSMQSFHAWLLWKQGYWKDELAHMRGVLAREIAARKKDGETVPKPSGRPAE